MKISLNLLFLFIAHSISAQPEITSWLQNTTETGSYYIAGNSVTIPNNILVNCQKVEYSADYVYITTTGIPAYPTGPFQDGNPSQAADQNMIYKIPRNPQENIGTPTSTTPGNIGVFIDRNNAYGDISILIGEKEFWGKGTAYHSIKGILPYLFEKEKLNLISCGTASCNLGMIKVMEKLGMTPKITFPDRFVINNQTYNLIQGWLKAS